MKSLLYTAIKFFKSNKAQPVKLDNALYLENLEWLRVESLRIGDLALYDELTYMRDNALNGNNKA